MNKVHDSFRFRNSDSVGAADADDDSYVDHCWVDTGVLDELMPTNSSKFILLGRTGAGKTATLRHLESRTSNVVRLSLEAVAFDHVCNSTVLRWLHDNGVQLQQMYNLLWRHVLVVEVLRKRLSGEITEESTGSQSIWEKIGEWLGRRTSGVKQKQHEASLAYLEKWGARFWQETDLRMREVTNNLQHEIEQKIVVGAKDFGSLQDSEKIKYLQANKEEIVPRAKNAVSQLQMRDLHNAFNLLNDVIAPENPIYLVIDRLDDNWVDDSLRYALIRALIESAKAFKEVRHAKVIVALRDDLLDAVLRNTYSHGMQREKYESLCLRVRWSPEQLQQMLDLRVQSLIRSRYTKELATSEKLLPTHVETTQGGQKIDGFQYLLRRSLRRPRDVIAFFNECIIAADGSPSISKQMLLSAERAYSSGRVRALVDEWKGSYPLIEDVLGIISGSSATFSVSELRDATQTLSTRWLTALSESTDPLFRLASLNDDSAEASDQFLFGIVVLLYRVGVLGLKLSSQDSWEWSYLTTREINPTELADSSKARVHPMFRAGLRVAYTSPEADT